MKLTDLQILSSTQQLWFINLCKLWMLIRPQSFILAIFIKLSNRLLPWIDEWEKIWLFGTVSWMIATPGRRSALDICLRNRSKRKWLPEFVRWATKAWGYEVTRLEMKKRSGVSSDCGGSTSTPTALVKKTVQAWRRMVADALKNTCIKLHKVAKSVMPLSTRRITLVECPAWVLTI